jgi:hypothetical protein
MTYNNEDSETCIWTYWVRPGAEADFRVLLAENWRILNRLGFVTDDPPLTFRSCDDPPVYVQIMTFAPGGMRPAHEHPDVIPVWEAVSRLVEERADHHNVPGMHFPFYRPAQLQA